MKLRWLRSGSVSLRCHVNFIAAENPDAARRVRHKVRSSVLRLLEFPESGRAGQIADTRELIVTNLFYVVVYRIRADTVEILRVLHTSQNPGKNFH